MYLRPPTGMPPAAFSSSAARLKPFIWNFPGGAIGPLSEVTMPTATLSWANAAVPTSAAASRIQRMDSLLFGETVDAKRVIAQELALGFLAQAERLDLLARAREVEHRKIGAEDDLVLAIGVDVLHERGGPVFRAVGVAADVDVGVLPRHGDHLVGPRDADVDADEL